MKYFFGHFFPVSTKHIHVMILKRNEIELKFTCDEIKQIHKNKVIIQEIDID